MVFYWMVKGALMTAWGADSSRNVLLFGQRFFPSSHFLWIFCAKKPSFLPLLERWRIYHSVNGCWAKLTGPQTKAA